MRWSWKRAVLGALVAFALALAGGAVCGAAEPRRFTDRASRFAAGIAVGMNCAACFAVIGVPVGFAIGGLSARRPRTKRVES